MQFLTRKHNDAFDGAEPGALLLTDSQAVYTPGISEHRSTGSLFYNNDALGSVRNIVNSSNAMTDDERFDAFGMTVYHGGQSPTTTPYGFVGKKGYQTDTSGLMLLGHRYYDAGIGRFLSRDPIGDGSNWYAYCGNNPLDKTDPSGESGDDSTDQAIDRAWTVAGAVGGGATLGTIGAGGGTLVAPGVGTIAGAAELGALGVAGGAIVGHTIGRGIIALRHVLEARGGGLEPNPNANGDHTTYKRGADGKIKRYQEWKTNTNPRNPNKFNPGKRYDAEGKAHWSKSQNRYVDPPHVQEDGDVHPAKPQEMPTR